MRDFQSLLDDVDEMIELAPAHSWLSPVVAAARLVAEAPEWLRQLIEGGYQLASPTLGDVIVLKVPPNTEDALELAEALRDALDRQVIVLEEGWEFDTADKIWWCETRSVGTVGFPDDFCQLCGRPVDESGCGLRPLLRGHE